MFSGICDVTCYLAVINFTDTGMPKLSQSFSDRYVQTDITITFLYL